MRLHFAITHYYDARGGGRHGSLSPDPKPRINALREVILQLHRLFGTPAGSLNHVTRSIDMLKSDQSIDITICVTDGKHLLAELSDLQAKGAFLVEVIDDIDPKHLGFHCHHILQSRYKQ